MAASGADILGIDICSKIIPVQEYAVTTRDDLNETGKLIQQHSRKFMPRLPEPTEASGVLQ